MGSAQKIVPPFNAPVAMLRRLQLVDLLGQIACFWLSTYLSYFVEQPVEGPVAKFALDRDLGLLFTLGTWQVVSALVHLLFRKRLPATKQVRRLYLFILAGLGFVIGGVLLTNSQMEDEGLMVLFGLLFLAPIWAALYFCVTALDVWALSAQTKGTVGIEAGRQVVPQAILLLIGLIPFYLFTAMSGVAIGKWYSPVIYLALLVLAGWLFVGYFKVWLLGQATPIEAFCAVWAAVTICSSLAEIVFTIHLPLPWSWVRPLLSPVVALPVWYTATLWRGPIRLRPVTVATTKDGSGT